MAAFARYVTYGFIEPLFVALSERGTIDVADIQAIDTSYLGIDEAVEEFKAAQEADWSVGAALLRTVAIEVAWGAFMQLVFVACQTFAPVCIFGVVTSIQDNSVVGAYWSLGLLLSQLLGNWCNQTHLHVMDVAALKARAVCIRVAVERLLKLRQHEHTRSCADLVAIISTDTERFKDVASLLHVVWGAPVLVVALACVGYAFIGVAALVGVAVMLLIFPFSAALASALRWVRSKTSAAVEGRLKLVSEMLLGMRVVKLYRWEAAMLRRIASYRNTEIFNLAKEMLCYLGSAAIAATFPQFAALGAFMTAIAIDGPLTSASTFGTLAVLTALKHPMNAFGAAALLLAQVTVSFQRIEPLLRCVPSAVDLTTVGTNPSEEALLQLEKATLHWRRPQQREPLDAPCEDDIAPFTLGPLSVTATRSEPVCIMGPVGSGKSMIMLGLLDEIFVAGGVQRKPCRVAYVAQEPQLFTGTIRDNIIFDLPYSEAKFESVCTACQLWPDLAIYPDREFTVVGERGVTLSGGQKARIAIARAAYAEADLVLLDDPFSALDARTGRLVLEALLHPQGGLLVKAAVVYTTNSPQHTWCARRLIEVKADSTIVTSDCIPGSDPASPVLSRYPTDDVAATIPNTTEPAGAKKEGIASGTVSFATYVQYFAAGGGVKFPLAMLLGLAIERTAYASADWWVTIWTSAGTGSPKNRIVEPYDLPSAATYSGGAFYGKVYCVMSCIALIGCCVRVCSTSAGGCTAAKNLAERAMVAVSRCPTATFDETPAGRFLTRLSYDVDRVQYTLIQLLCSSSAVLGWAITSIVVVAAVVPPVLGFIVPALLLVAFLFVRFRAVNVALQRVEANRKSAVQGFIFETLNGAVAIRAFSSETRLNADVTTLVQENVASMYFLAMAQRWVGIRVDTLGAVMLGATSFTLWGLRDSVTPGLVGLALLWATSLCRSFVFLMTDVVQGEAKFVSVERLLEYSTDLPAEPDNADEVSIAPAEWPPQGNLRFVKVQMRYRETLPLVLRDTTFDVAAGQRVAVVGRTGSGKSSLAVALFRLRTLEGGCIEVDGTDISTLPLDTLRGGRMCIIPQDPVLFSGTVRYNVDPFENFSDKAVWNALAMVRLRSHVEALEGGLDAAVQDRGANFSVGQRQLFCIARAILRRPKILVMDEATANVDVETDGAIQDAIRTSFAGHATIIEIAHRLHSVMDADEIVVMDAGVVCEHGSPSSLLDDPRSVLSEMVTMAGEEVASALRQRAYAPRKGST